MSTLNTYNLKSPDSASTNLALDASGNVAIQTGSASAPSIYVTGDANTGIYSPGADQVALTTGGSARLYINSSGQVGIGTTTLTWDTEIARGAGVSAYFAARGNNSTAANAFIFGQDSSGLSRIFQDGNQSITFWTGSAATERARIDSSGRLLVGTSSARTGAFFNGDANSNPLLQIERAGNGADTAGCSISLTRNTTVNTGPYIILARSTGTTQGSVTAVANNDVIGFLTYQAADGTDFVEAARIEAAVDGTPGANDMPGRLVFSTTADGASSPTERMRINNTGTLSVYGPADNPSVNFSVSHGPGSHQSLAIYSGGSSTTSLGTKQFFVQNNGDVRNTNNSYGAISDLRLKENIVDANSQWDDLKALQVRNYNFKEGQTHTQIGLIAQEAELVSPGLVTESPDRDEEGNDLGTVTKSVNYSVLYMKAVKALQEAMERIETLEAEVTALKAQ